MSPGNSEKGSAGGGVPWKKVAILALIGNVVFLFSLGMSGGSGSSSEVNGAIDEYFRVWSAQNMEAYRECFHPAAVINFVNGDGAPVPSGLGPFVEGQRQAHANSNILMREIPLSKDTKVDGSVAQSVVRWKLFNEGGEQTGTDYFTFLKTKNGWKIISLIFLNDA